MSLITALLHLNTTAHALSAQAAVAAQALSHAMTALGALAAFVLMVAGGVLTLAAK